MSHESVPKPRTVKEKLQRVGAYTGMLLSLSGVVAEGASAQPNKDASRAVAAQTEAGRAPKDMQTIPSGVSIKAIANLITHPNLIQKEALDALTRKKEQWPGVLVLRTPTKPAEVGFNDAPVAYGSSLSRWGTLNNPALKKQGNGLMLVYEPYLLKYPVPKAGGGSENHLFALVYTPQSVQPQFLDLNFAEEVGALMSFAYDGIPLKPIAPGSRNTQPAIQEPDDIASKLLWANIKAGKVVGNEPGKTQIRHMHQSSVMPYMK